LSDVPSSPPEASPPSTETQLSQLFGSYKAEWLSEQLFDLFTEPGYWPELTTNRPCVLEGGRGTGKTTVLRVLSYEGQFALAGRHRDSVGELPFIGLYSRVDTNRVRAFSGTEVSDDVWARIFAHYLNLSMCMQCLTFAEWFQLRSDGKALLGTDACREIAVSLNLDSANDQTALLRLVRTAILSLESQVNNIGEAAPTALSMQKAPVDVLVGHLKEAIPNKPFFFLFDEYENFDEYQQRVVNTLIKHSGDGYSFKIGVREMGMRTRATINVDEQLVSPADYVRISIAEKLYGPDFKAFAARVCNSRLALIETEDGGAEVSIEELLPELSEDAEAELLGGQRLVAEALSTRASQLAPDEVEQFRSLRLRDQLTVVQWTSYHDEALTDAVREVLAKNATWQHRFNNYGYAVLFTLRRGRGQRGVQKYYAGWDVLATMAAGNIRYVLELVEQSLLLHLREGASFPSPVQPAIQTQSAQAVGRKNLTELEGLSVHGAQLTRLVLGLGRIFELFALSPLGHTPEINEFELAEARGERPDSDVGQEAADLIRSAVMHLALLRYPANKMSLSPTDTRDFNYRLHPIFSAAFAFSHRRKRKMQLTDQELMGLVKTARTTLPEIVKGHRGTEISNADEPLPDQLRLFESYLRGH
jgi:hypothetical protein